MTPIIVGNVIALIASFLMIYAGYIKVKKKILFIQIIQLLLSALSNLVLGGYTGAIINVVSCVRDTLCFKDKLGTKEKIIIIIVSGIFTVLFNNKGWLGYLPFIITTIYIIFISIKDIKKFKILVILVILAWTIYDIGIKLYTAAAFDIMTIITNSIALIQIIRKERKEE